MRGVWTRLACGILGIKHKICKFSTISEKYDRIRMYEYIGLMCTPRTSIRHSTWRTFTKEQPTHDNVVMIELWIKLQYKYLYV